ncbi:ATP-dependent RNA helicase DHX8 [Phaeosphaeriaceae sp. SRC1lsM3a]|nr:ATP-dependent RNA helicase DHX8 [Stagonospora sp. SRC1lsM3a]
MRQIRAHHTSTTITVYQAYNAEIADAAIEQQKLDASPRFSTTRMTWIKPSWAWMLYRSGYSYKDAGQERILALSLTHATFLSLLKKAQLSYHSKDKKDAGASGQISVRVQWDPERTVRLERLPYRSIQIGVPGAMVAELVEGIVKIEDVTERARALKNVLNMTDNIDDEDLIVQGLVLNEPVFDVDEGLKELLDMNEN